MDAPPKTTISMMVVTSGTLLWLSLCGMSSTS
jgi:hypothetical protein